MKRSGLLGKVCVALGMFLVMLSVGAFLDRAEGGCAWVSGAGDCVDQPIALCGNVDCNPSNWEGDCVCAFNILTFGCRCDSL